MAISAKAPNFTLAEFERVSVRALNEQEREHAAWHAERLQAVRDALNETYLPPSSGGDWQIFVTSFVRSGSGDHATGAGVDWNVRDKNGNRYFDLTRWGRDWLAINRPNDFAELIFERDHTHAARRGFSQDASANETPQILDEPQEGRFVIASIQAIPKPVRPVALALVVGGAAYLASKALA